MKNENITNSQLINLLIKHRSKNKPKIYWNLSRHHIDRLKTLRDGLGNYILCFYPDGGMSLLGDEVKESNTLKPSLVFNFGGDEFSFFEFDVDEYMEDY